jgi:hypothetical protein
MAGGKHQGDWEHITVTVKSSQTAIHSIFYAQHTNGQRAYPPGVQVQTGSLNGIPIYAPNFRYVSGSTQRPKSYPANDSHANYPTLGTNDRGVLPADDHRGGGVVLDCATRVVEVGDFNPGDPRQCVRGGATWLKYGGLWGELGTGLLHTSGPLGPAYASAWKPAAQM